MAPASSTWSWLHRPLLKYTRRISGWVLWMLACNSSSKLVTDMELFWGNRAQHRGVANTKQKPTNVTWIGALIHGNLFKKAFFSKVFMINGGMAMPGAAMRILEMTTCVMACFAALVDSPKRVPFSSVTGIPTFSSLCLISGMLMQLAAATAAKGTKRPISGETR